MTTQRTMPFKSNRHAKAPPPPPVITDTDAEAPLQRSDSWHESQLYQMISEKAYYRAEQRGFTPGEELADWLAAEMEVRALLSAPQN